MADCAACSVATTICDSCHTPFCDDHRGDTGLVVPVDGVATTTSGRRVVVNAGSSFYVKFLSGRVETVTPPSFYRSLKPKSRPASEFENLWKSPQMLCADCRTKRATLAALNQLRADQVASGMSAGAMATEQADRAARIKHHLDHVAARTAFYGADADTLAERRAAKIDERDALIASRQDWSDRRQQWTVLSVVKLLCVVMFVGSLLQALLVNTLHSITFLGGSRAVFYLLISLAPAALFSDATLDDLSRSTSRRYTVGPLLAAASLVGVFFAQFVLYDRLVKTEFVPKGPTLAYQLFAETLSLAALVVPYLIRVARNSFPESPDAQGAMAEALDADIAQLGADIETFRCGQADCPYGC